MTEVDFLNRIKCLPVPATDRDGNPIPYLEGLYFKPLDVDDMLAVHEYTERQGKGAAFRMMFVRALCNPDGSRILSDEAADIIGKGYLAGPIGEAIPRIREISGQAKDVDEERQKKTSLTNGQT